MGEKNVVLYSRDLTLKPKSFEFTQRSLGEYSVQSMSSSPQRKGLCSIFGNALWLCRRRGLFVAVIVYLVTAIVVVAALGKFSMKKKPPATPLAQEMKHPLSDRKTWVNHSAIDSSNLLLEQHFGKILQGCGDICNTSITGKHGIFFEQITKKVDCSAIWRNTAIDESRPIGPAPDVPSKFLNLFNYNGQVQITKFSRGLLNQQYAGGKAETSIWKQDQIQQWADDCGKGKLNGNYGISATRSVYEGLLKMPSLKGGHILVLGSENPWIESCILRAGARHVTTIEYGSIVSEHPLVSTMTPHVARNAYLNGILPLFDAIVTYSSLEHSGLGRYGDQLNPWGDLQSVARAWCVCKPGGDMLLGIMETAKDSK